MSGLLQLCEMAKDSEFWVTNLTCWWTIMVWKILASWFFLVHFQGPEGYSPTFQTRTRILCLGDTFETQLPSSGSSCFPWISFCSDRPASLTSHLKGRSETGSVRLSERKESHNIPGHFYSSVFWVTDIDQALEQGRLTFYSLVGMKWGEKGEAEGTGRHTLSRSLPLEPELDSRYSVGGNSLCYHLPNLRRTVTLYTPLHYLEMSYFLCPGIIYSVLNPREADRIKTTGQLCLFDPNVHSTLSDLPTIHSVSGLSTPLAVGKSK